MGTSEEELPGIGRRYELDVRDRDRLVAVVHHGGRRDLFAFQPGAAQPHGSVRLDEDGARQLGAILSGNHYRPAGDPLTTVLGRFVVDSVEIGPGSPVTGRSIDDLAIRERTGVTVVAIVTGPAAMVDPPPSTVVAAGDTVMVVGQPPDIAAFRALVDRREPAS